MTMKLYVNTVILKVEQTQTNQMLAQGYVEIKGVPSGQKGDIIVWDAHVNHGIVRFEQEKIFKAGMEKDLRLLVLDALSKVNVPFSKTGTIEVTA